MRKFYESDAQSVFAKLRRRPVTTVFTHRREPKPNLTYDPAIRGTMRGLSLFGIQLSLHSMGLLDLYIRSTLNPKMQRRLVEHEKYLQTQASEHRESQLNQERAWGISSVKNLIALKKFGTVEMTPRQAKAVDAAYKMQSKRTRHPDVKLAQELVASFQQNVPAVKRALAKLIKNLSAPLPTDAFIENDGKPDVCPHVIARAKGIVRSGQTSDLATDRHVSSAFAGWGPAGSHCRICGEWLAAADSVKATQFLNGVQTWSKTTFDPLQKLIWRESTSVVSSFVRFSTMSNAKMVTTSVANAIYPEISKVREVLRQVESQDEQARENILLVHISVYIFAVLMRMIFLSKNIFFADMHDRSKHQAPKPSAAKTGGRKQSKNVMHQMFDTSIRLVNQIRKTQIAARA